MSSLSGTTWDFTAPQRNFSPFDLQFKSDNTVSGQTTNGNFSFTGSWQEIGDAGLFSAHLIVSNGTAYVMSGHHSDNDGAGVLHGSLDNGSHYSMNFNMNLQ